jgi:large subunit ribosomal protein L29
MSRKDLNELKKLGALELRERLNELKSNLYRLRMQLRLGQIKDNAAIGRTRRDIARVLTFLKTTTIK